MTENHTALVQLCQDLENDTAQLRDALEQKNQQLTNALLRAAHVVHPGAVLRFQAPDSPLTNLGMEQPVKLISVRLADGTEHYTEDEYMLEVFSPNTPRPIEQAWDAAGMIELYEEFIDNSYDLGHLAWVNVERFGHRQNDPTQPYLGWILDGENTADVPEDVAGQDIEVILDEFIESLEVTA